MQRSVLRINAYCQWNVADCSCHLFWSDLRNDDGKERKNLSVIIYHFIIGVKCMFEE